MRWKSHALGLAVALTVAAVVALADDPRSPPWKFDVVRLKNGAVFRGLILERTPAIIRFQDVRQKPGRPTVLFYTTFAASEIDSVEALDPSERDRLAARLSEIGHEQSDKQRSARIQISPCEWRGRADAGWQYRSDCFVLTSNAGETIVRRSAARLEQIYAAYARYLPPRVELAKPTTIELIRSLDEYAECLKSEGRPFTNTAFYDPGANRIVCGADLARISDDLEHARIHHQRLRADLDQREVTLARLYKGAELTRLLQPLRATRGQIVAAERAGEAAFDAAARQLFAVLYHEAFHAYLARFVYPPPAPEPPRWLNEGLAQLFESALVEAGELRVGQADRERLARAKELVRKGEFLSLRELVGSTAPQFLSLQPDMRHVVDRHYLAAWAAAHHLTFDRRLLGSPAMEEYLRSLAFGTSPEAAFAAFVGQPIADYERDLAIYIQRLQPDGTLAPAAP